MKIRRLRGTEDILPDEIPAWRSVEDLSRKRFALYGYREIRTPVIEASGLFMRGLGEDTDIVKKQMYIFKDQGDRSICLRPEETASVVRSYIENNIDKKEGFVKYFYIGPMFRSERPQAGRLRQFHQIGIEAIGSYSPYLDAEVMILLDDLLRGYGLSEYIFKINSLGCEKDKDRLKAGLKKGLRYSLNALCMDCRRRYSTNILRILDCKNKSCQGIVKSAAPTEGFLCRDCSGDFSSFRDTLDECGINYEFSPSLVRGLDYYTKIVFEVTANALGAQDAIAAGGRYDNLVAEFGGPNVGACGFAIGTERLIRALDGVSPCAARGRKDTVFIAAMGKEAYAEGFRLLNRLRKAGIPARIDYQGKASLKAQMRFADRMEARYVIIIGENELKDGNAILKNMADGSQENLPMDKIAVILKTQGLSC